MGNTVSPTLPSTRRTVDDVPSRRTVDDVPSSGITTDVRTVDDQSTYACTLQQLAKAAPKLSGSTEQPLPLEKTPY